MKSNILLLYFWFSYLQWQMYCSIRIFVRTRTCVEIFFLLLLKQRGNILLINILLVKALKPSLITQQKYSVYWFIHSIREIPLLGIKSLFEQLDQKKSLTREWSIGGLFSVYVASDSNSHWSGSSSMTSNVKPASRLWNSKQSWTTALYCVQ